MGWREISQPEAYTLYSFTSTVEAHERPSLTEPEKKLPRNPPCKNYLNQFFGAQEAAKRNTYSEDGSLPRLKVCLVPITRVKRGHQIPQNWSYSHLGVTIWMLGSEPWSSIRTVNALTHRDISLAFITLLTNCPKNETLSKIVKAYNVFNCACVC